ncbi:DUF6456 domain-containing protein [Pedomonas sp. V897]|uniref:DUF6456 domain-containing protein n=1 Tax=Pedomonas sp. V897 TaxID=3446482 RepID=UPI003EE0D47E
MMAPTTVKAAVASTKPHSGVTVSRQDDSPVAWLSRHGHLSRRQVLAAERLQQDYRRARLSPRTTQSWDMVPAVGGRRGPQEVLNPTEAMLDARKRVHAAMDAVGPGLGDVLWRVVCEGEGMDAAERALGWPRRAAKLVLCLALDRLADHYDPPARSPFLRD